MIFEEYKERIKVAEEQLEMQREAVARYQRKYEEQLKKSEELAEKLDEI